MAFTHICLSGVGFEGTFDAITAEKTYTRWQVNEGVSYDDTGLYVLVLSDEQFDVADQFTVETTRRYYPRAAGSLPSITTATQNRTFDTTMCTNYDANNGFNNRIVNKAGEVAYWYAFPLKSDNGEIGIFNGRDADPAKTLDYAERDVDYCKIEFAIDLHESVTAAVIASGYEDLIIDMIPKYEIESFTYISSKYFEVVYSTSFGRYDDIFQLNNTSKYSPNTAMMTSNLQGSRTSWGWDGVNKKMTVRLQFNIADLTSSPLNKTVILEASAWHIWDSYAERVDISKTLTVASSAYCTPPAVDVEVIGFTLVLHVSPAGANTKQTATHATAHLVEGDFPEDYFDFDLDGTVDITFLYPPLNTPLTVEVVGSVADSDDASITYYSEPVEVPCSVSAGLKAPVRIIESLSGLFKFYLRFKQAGSNRGPSISVANDGETRQLLDRRRPSVFYGGAGTNSISLSGVLIDDPGQAWEELPQAGICILRIPDGRRYAIDPKQVSIDQTRQGITTISLSAQEVDYRA